MFTLTKNNGDKNEKKKPRALLLFNRTWMLALRLISKRR